MAILVVASAARVNGNIDWLSIDERDAIDNDGNKLYQLVDELRIGSSVIQ